MIPQQYFEKVKKHFEGSATQAWAWFNSNHNALNGLSPLSMIKTGRKELVKRVIDEGLKKGKL
jgi:hypothetical protein